MGLIRSFSLLTALSSVMLNLKKKIITTTGLKTLPLKKLHGSHNHPVHTERIIKCCWEPAESQSLTSVIKKHISVFYPFSKQLNFVVKIFCWPRCLMKTWTLTTENISFLLQFLQEHFTGNELSSNFFQKPNESRSTRVTTSVQIVFRLHTSLN